MPGLQKRQPSQEQTQPRMEYKTPLERAKMIEETPRHCGPARESAQSTDAAVNHPSHYTATRMEAIEIIKLITENEKNGFAANLIGNIVKYIIRFRHKNGVQDLKKARWYLDRLIQEVESEHPQ